MSNLGKEAVVVRLKSVEELVSRAAAVKT